MIRRSLRAGWTWTVSGALVALMVVAIAVWLAVGGASSQSTLPPEKEAILQFERDFRAGLTTPIGPFDPDATPLPWTPPEPASNIPRVPAGAGVLWDTGWSSFVKYFHIENQWKEKNGDNWINVAAGAPRDAPRQGIVIVEAWAPPGIEVVSTEYYPTPEKAGSVRIVGAEGEVLSLTTLSGVKFLFDVASRTYLDPVTLAPLPPVPMPTPAPGALAGFATAGSAGTVAIDTDVFSSPANSATSLGSTEACNTLSTAPLYTGTSTGGNTATTLNDTAQGFPAGNGLLGKAVRVTTGAGAGQTRMITANSATQLTVNPVWTTIPDGTSAYQVVPTLYVDVTVDAIPAYDPGTDTGGISGLGFNLTFDGSLLSVVGYNPGGDSDILLAAGGPRQAADGVDADAYGTLLIEPLPSTSGSMRLELGDLSEYVESGSGVLVRLVFVGVGTGVSSVTLYDLLLLDAAGEEYQAGVTGGAIAVNSACP